MARNSIVAVLALVTSAVIWILNILQSSTNLTRIILPDNCNTVASAVTISTPAEETTMTTTTSSSISVKSSSSLGFSKFIHRFDSKKKRVCPCCGWTGFAFDPSPYGTHRPEAMCPQCRGMERHRQACAVLGTAGDSLLDLSLQEPSIHHSNMFRLLHFGPHPQMAKVLDTTTSTTTGIDHIWLDFSPSKYTKAVGSTQTLQADVSNLTLPDNFAHGAMLFHVLEHVHKVDTALRELHRIVKHPNGWLLVEVPISATTADCRNLTSDAERTICAGQYDHVWRFGRKDWETWLEQAGWVCKDGDVSGRIIEAVGKEQFHAMQPYPERVQQYLCRSSLFKLCD